MRRIDAVRATQLRAARAVQLQIGNQPPVTIPESGICDWQLTNYSTCQNQPVNLTHRMWCDSQEVVVTKTLTPPVQGIFIGVAGDGTTCLPPTTNISAYSRILVSS
jgi:hypothetical protein